MEIYGSKMWGYKRGLFFILPLVLEVFVLHRNISRKKKIWWHKEMKASFFYSICSVQIGFLIGFCCFPISVILFYVSGIKVIS